MKSGKGIIHYEEGGKYQGNFENDQKNGQGVYISPKNIVLKSEF